jgi:hypothetical protein
MTSNVVSRGEARSLVQHLSDQAGACVADSTQLARVVCHDSRAEARRPARHQKLLC